MSALEWRDSLLAIGPEIALLILAVIVLFVDHGLKRSQRRTMGLITGWGALGILLFTLGLWFFFDIPSQAGNSYWGGAVRHDMVSLVFRVMFLIALMITSLVSLDFKGLQRGEYYALLMTATIGFSLMSASGDLVLLYVALETASISLYILAAFSKNVYRSNEAGMKYFIYGAFASAVMLYGLSLLYGMTGETNLTAIANVIIGAPEVTVLLAAALVVVGFSFKISAVPYHFWTPDVYEGAPTPVTGFVSTASKAAGFAVFLRVFTAGVFGRVQTFELVQSNGWWAMLVAMCIVTMTLGNMLAIRQKNIKRMLAYSSIAQAGYALMGLVIMTVSSTGATMFFLLYYVVSNVAAFGVIIMVSNLTNSDEIADLSGLSRRSPGLALAMLIALLSLGGIPPTAGFFGKFFIFRATIQVADGDLWWLAMIGIINAFIGLYYYLSVAKYMYLYRSDEEDVKIPVPRASAAAIGAAVFGILYLGVLANSAFEWTREAASAFFAMFIG